MSTLISGEKLKRLIKDGIIENGKEDNVEGIKYDFRLGDRFLKTKHQGPAHISDFSVEAKENYSIEPGETVFVLSYEKLNLPKNIKAELSNKRKLAHLGIFILGGFCVDPLYEGYLIFGMYNLSNQPFLLGKENNKLIAAQFYELSEEEITDFPKPKSLFDFPDDLIAISKGMKSISLQGIDNKISKLANQLSNLEKDFRERDDWFKAMQKNVGGLLQSINTLKSSLETEKNIRGSGISDLKKIFEKSEKSINQLAILLQTEKNIREGQQDHHEKLIEEQRKSINALVSATATEKLLRKGAVWLIGIIIAGAIAISITNISKQISFGEMAKPLKSEKHIVQPSKVVTDK